MCCQYSDVILWIVFICMERVVMCCQYSDVILWNCIYLYWTCCDVLPIQWCYTKELYLFVLNVLWCVANTVMLYYGLYLFVWNVLWCVANTVMLYYGIVFICKKRVVMCCQYSDVILRNCVYLYGTCCDVLPIQWYYTMDCIYLYGTCCDVLPIQWCYTMELYLFVRNVLWCVANTVMLY